MLALTQFVDSLSAPKSEQPLRICFVTPELTQFHLNGGIGTAVSGLIEALNAAGHQISVLYTGWAPAKDEPEGNHPRWYSGLRTLQSSNINVDFVSRLYEQRFLYSSRHVSYACYDYLKRTPFDVIHFVDYGGCGYYSCLAKRCGAAFARSTLVTTVHGPTLWASELDQNPIVNLHQFERTVLEHKAISNSDICIALSEKLVEWLSDKKVALPARTYLHKNCHPHLPAGPRLHIAPQGLKQVAFFGRVEQRKGGDLFVDGVTPFLKRHPDIEVCFVGRFATIEGEHSAGYVLDRLSKISNRVRFLHKRDRDGAVRFLTTPGTLAVMPSHDENSPCVVVECQTAGIPFVTTAVGGIPELVKDEDQARVLIAPTGAALTQRLDEIWANGHDAVDTRDSAAEIAAIWRKFHWHLAPELELDEDSIEEPAQDRPLVSVCITHYRRPHLLPGLIAAIEKQTYPNIEIVLVDDGSGDPATRAMLARLSDDAARMLPLKIVVIENAYLGAARNEAAANASGAFLKFQDDDNLPLPCEVELLVRAAEATSADVVTCFSYMFRGKPPQKPTVADVDYFPLGECGALSYIRNEFGDANALVRTRAFVELGGFTTDRGVGCEDFEFFARIVSCGKTLVCVPEPLFFYRVAPDSMLQKGSVYRNAMRARRGFAHMPAASLSIFQDMELGRHINDERRNFAWGRVGQYDHGWLHHQLMEGDPNSDINSRRIAELLGHYGRAEDAVRFMMENHSMTAGLEWVGERSKTFISRRNPHAPEQGRAVYLDFREDQGVKLLSPQWTELPSYWSTEWEIIAVREYGLLVHPVGSLTTIAWKPQAVPQAARRITARWLHTNAAGGLAEVSVQIGPDSEASSEWVAIHPTDGPIDIVLDIHPLQEPTDLYIKSRAVGSDTAVWPCLQFVKIDLDVVETQPEPSMAD